MAVCLPFAGLCLAESALVWTGSGVDAELVRRSERDPSAATHFLNPRADFAYCHDDLRGPEPRGFELPRPEGTYRVVVLGASSVQGYPYPSELSFPAHLQLLLQRQLVDRKVEVLNAGIIGISSTPLVDIARQASAADPDLVVVYAGHNEFYGVGGVCSNAAVSSAGVRLRHFRLAQLVPSWFEQPDPVGPDMAQELISRLPRSYRIDIRSELISQAERQYHDNLTAVVSSLRACGIATILCSVASNLRDQSPLVLTEDQTAWSELELRIRPLINDSRTDEALHYIDEAIVRQPDVSILHFRRAQCLESLGQWPAAAEAFARARDLDPCRYRAPGSFRDIVQDVAESAGPTVHFLDTGALLAAQTDYAAPGEDLFLEHVHLTQRGHWLVARGIARTAVSTVLNHHWDEQRVPSETERELVLGIIPEDHLVACYLALSVSQTPPFNEAVDGELHGQLLGHRIQEIAARLPSEDLTAFMALEHAEQVDDLIDSLGRAMMRSGRADRAIELFRKSIRRRPWMPNGYVFLAMCHALQGHRTECQRCLDASRTTVMPESDELLQTRTELLRNL